MRFLLDQGLPRSAVQHLASRGLASDHVGQVGLASASDEVILAEGRLRQAVVVTLDADFHALLAKSNASSPSVIRIRVQGLKGEAVASLVEQVAITLEDELRSGAAVTVSDRRVAVRRLPLTNPSVPPGIVTDGGGR